MILMKKNKAIFLDRDGTLIVDVGYPDNPDDVKLIQDTVPVLKELQKQGYLLIVISNQSGIGRGMFSEADADAVHQRFLAVFKEQGITIDASYYCPHAPEDHCTCRKPSPEMLLRASDDYAIDLSRSFMIGDKLSDVAAGQNAGCKGILYKDSKTGPDAKVQPDLVSVNWDEIAVFIAANA
jgi:D-glycero-D-manno-heptose 1,7-bisphosphate phosphatase